MICGHAGLLPEWEWLVGEPRGWRQHVQNMFKTSLSCPNWQSLFLMMFGISISISVNIHKIGNNILKYSPMVIPVIIDDWLSLVYLPMV